MLFWVNFLLILIALLPDDVRILLREYSIMFATFGREKQTPFALFLSPDNSLYGKDDLWSKNGRTNPQTDEVIDGQTDEQTDERTDKPTEY